jgi:hypothetical protein
VQIAKVIAQFWLETMRTLADKLVLPLNVSRYALTLRDYAVQLDDSFGAVMRDHGMSLGKIINCTSLAGHATATNESMAANSRLDCGKCLLMTCVVT